MCVPLEENQIFQTYKTEILAYESSALRKDSLPQQTFHFWYSLNSRFFKKKFKNKLSMRTQKTI